jgi:ABC-type transport system involved in multi-copper enzyme maturation permease subunit
MAEFWLVASNTFEEALRRKIIYILVFVGLVLGAEGLYNLVYMGMAEQAGETEMLASMRASFLLSLFTMMEVWGVILAVFLGSVALSSEIKNRTIVPVLSRPVGRFSFFCAKWAGTMGFLGVFVGLGVLAGIALTLHWSLSPTPLFALGILEIFVTVAVLSALSVAISSFFHPVLAGGGALIVLYANALLGSFANHPNAVLSALGNAGRYLGPAQIPVSLLESGLTKGLLNPDYGLYVSVLCENAGYALVAILAGGLIFQSREIYIR